MIASSKYKHFKRINFSSNTFTPLDMRSSIIRTIQGYHSHANTANLRRSEKQAQINKIDTQKTDKLFSIYDRALLALSYYDIITRSDPGKRKGVEVAPSLALSGVFGEFSKFKSSSVGLEKRSDFL